MCVFRSKKHIYVQIIDDLEGKTLASASTMEKDLKSLKGRATCEGAKKIGELIAERAKAKGIENIVFDRGGYIFHGRVKSLADAARQKGLKF
jgi:large subunit ribosomal protein L18